MRPSQKRLFLTGCTMAGLALMAWLWLEREPPPALGMAEPARPVVPGAREPAKRVAALPASTPAIGARPASPPAAARPRRAASADWSKVLASMSLADVLQKAQASTRSDDRRSAVWAWAVCSAASADLPRLSPDQAAEIAHAEAEPQFIKRTAEKMLASRKRLIEFCGDHDAPALRAALETLVSRSKREASASHTVLAMRGSSPPSQWSQEQTQAVQLVLSNPQSYPRALDHLLEQVLATLPGVEVGQLTMSESLQVRSMAYQLLSGDQDPDSVRNLHLCFNHAICDVYREADAMPPDQQRLLGLAQGVVQAIRTQRWEAFGL